MGIPRASPRLDRVQVNQIGGVMSLDQHERDAGDPRALATTFSHGPLMPLAPATERDVSAWFDEAEAS